MEQFLYNKVDFGASDFEAALSLQIEARGKIMGGAQLLGSKSLEISFPMENFFLLTIPNVLSPAEGKM